MADLQHQMHQTLIVHEHNAFIVTFNILLINLAASTSTHAILAFIVPILVAFIQIKFPGISVLSSPFETHRNTTIVAIASLLAYCMAVGVSLRFPAWARSTWYRFSILFLGLLSVASLLSILLPDSWNHVPYIMYIIYVMGEAFQLVRSRLRRTRTLLPLSAS